MAVEGRNNDGMVVLVDGIKGHRNKECDYEDVDHHCYSNSQKNESLYLDKHLQ